MENVQGTYPFSYLPLTQFRIQQSWQITKWIHSRNISIFIFAIQISKQKRGKFQNGKRSRNISIFIFAILILVQKPGKLQNGYVHRTFPFSYLPLTSTQFQPRWQITKWILSRKIPIFIFTTHKLSTTKLANYRMDTFLEQEHIHFHICH